MFPEKTEDNPAADPPIITLTLVILAVLPEPASVIVSVVKVTAPLLGLFTLT